MTARRCRPGTSCRSSSNRSAITSDELRDSPVTLPPGCISVSTRPRETGSSTPTRTIGIVAFALVAASVAGVPAVTRIVAPEPISSLTMAGSASVRSSAQRSRTLTLLPSVQPKAETVAERNEKSVILLSGPRLDKADARGFDLGRGLAPGHRHHPGEQQKIAAFHWFNSPTRSPY